MHNYQHILVAVDFTAEAGAIAARARELAGRYGARLTLMHVVEYMPPMNLVGEPFGTEWVIDEQVLRDGAVATLNEFAAKEGLDDVTRLVTVGMPRIEILRIAEEQRADMIVLGSHGRHGFARLIGSTARSVLNEAPCDVLAVRIKE